MYEPEGLLNTAPLRSRFLARAALLRVLENRLTTLEETLLAEKMLVEEEDQAALEITDEHGQPITDLDDYDIQQRALAGVVGQRFQFAVRARRPDAHITDIRWEIAGQTIRSYILGGLYKTAHTVPLTDIDKGSNLIQFHWLTGGSYTVQVSAMVAGRQATATFMCDIWAPTVERFELRTSDVHLCPDGTFPKQGDWLALYDPDGNGTPGCQWEAAIRARLRRSDVTRVSPSGRVGFIQLVQIHGEWTVDSQPPQRFMRSSRLVPDPADLRNFALDGGAVISPLYSVAKVLQAGTRVSFNADDQEPEPDVAEDFDWSTHDSPAMRLRPEMSRVSVDYRFRLYLVYRPDIEDAIWVTLQLAEWSWTGAIDREGDPNSSEGGWRILTSTVDPLPNSVGHGNLSFELPTWTLRANYDIEEQPAPADS